MAEKHEMEPHLRPYRWVMLALAWLLYVTFGLIFRSVSPMVTPIIRDLNISYSQMGLILGSWQLAYIAVAIIAGTVIDKWGVRKSLFFGVVIMGLSAVLRYFSSGFSTLLPAVALLGVGGPLVSIGAPKTISIWFQGKSRGTAIGAYTTGAWVGGIVALSATNSLVMPLTGYSWRLTFVCYGLLTFAVALVWWFLAKDTKQAGAAESGSFTKVLSRLLRVRNVRIVLIIALLSFAITHGFTNWLPKILENGGLPPVTAGFAASIPLFAGVPAVLLIPRLVPPRLRGRVLAVMALVVISGLMISVTTHAIPLLVGLILFGMTGFCLFPFVMLILMETPEVEPRYMGLAGGIFFCIGEIGGFGGPLVMGALVDLTGGFLAGGAFLAVLSLVIFAVTFLLKAPAPLTTKP